MRIAPVFLRSATILALLLVPGALRLANASEPSLPTEVSLEQAKFFEEHIRPLLVTQCVKCHGADKQSGDLRLDSRAGLLLGGESGPSVTPGKPEESLLIEAINYASYEMPPDGKLPDEQIALLTKWVELGAPWPGEMAAAPVRAPGSKLTEADRNYWCFQPLQHPTPPVVAGDDWSRTDVDRFLFARLQEAQLAPQAEADRLTLIRRATQIVTGLPPTLAEIDHFLSDDSPAAYETLIDRLLDSPRRGEHLAQFWLDLVRYAESDGYKADYYRPDAWRYRDYVVRAFNTDKPYDLFVMEQLAGDELNPHDPDALAATGYLRNGIYEYNQRDAETQWKTMLEDITDTTADAFLALGMGCAKCHDHKFDPILQADYFQLQAFFSNIGPRDGTPLATPAELAAHQAQLAAWEAATQEIRAEIAALETPHLQRLEADAVKAFIPELQAIWRKPAQDRSAYERQIAWLIGQQVIDAQKKLNDKFKDEAKTRRDELYARLKEFDALKPQPLPLGLTVADVAPQPSPLFIPGKPRLGEMTPAFLTVLGQSPPVIAPTEAAPDSTGRRAALARWLTQPDHPLTSRVIVNRLWQQCFGTGLVATPSDFGRLGEPPSHPELLDWLATEFVAHGWSLKWLQRELLLSAAFRQASVVSPSASDAINPEEVDPANRLLWRFPVRRLRAEQIRDALLAVSGELDLAAGGASKDDSSTRRAVYLKVYRNQRDDVLDAFDFPDRITSSGERNVTTSPTQSLLMINSDWTLQRARQLARRVSQEVAGGDDSRIRHAYRLAFGRDPHEPELLRDAQFLQRRRDAAGPAQSPQPITRSMLLTGSPAAAVTEASGELPLAVAGSAELPQGDFTIEAVVLLQSLYADATVRTIASRWDGDTNHPGWSLGVTSTKSRYQPRNLILQLVGSDAEGKLQYEVLPSNIRLELGQPYYVACCVSLRETGEAGVTFHVRDLLDPNGTLQSVGVPHRVTGGVDNELPVLLGGRHANDRHRWDGLLDEVRLSAAPLAVDQLLTASRRQGLPPREVPIDQLVGQWTFDAADARGQDVSGQEHHLGLVGHKGPADDAPFVDFCHVLLNANEFLYVD